MNYTEVLIGFLIDFVKKIKTEKS